MRDCGTCGQPTPEGNFCVRCGAPEGAPLEHSRQRSQYAAAPGQGRHVPWLVSTLFPQLPKHSERHFHFALGLGGAIVVALAADRLFGVALIFAALLMPLVTVLYLYDVDVYERHPVSPLVWTIAWGAIAGVAIGLLARATAPTGTALIDRSSTGQVLVDGLLLPGVGALATLGGPLMLMRDERFNDALDGATFGAVAAATFSAAVAIVVGAGLVEGGLRPPGPAAPWIERMLALSVATPVLSMSAIGFATGALWLRFRSPTVDRNALGFLGRPPVALILAVALVMAGAVAETFMAVGLWLAWLLVLDTGALLLLRRAVHVGLLEESAEREIGPELTCANCGARTATHTFCGNCGIALRALPSPDTDPADGPRGAAAGRLTVGGGHRRRLLAGVGLLAIGAGLAFLAVDVATPAGRKPLCQVGVPCGAPPIAHVLAGFPGYTSWQSSGLGFSLRYRQGDWSVADQSATGVALQSSDGISVLIVRGAPSSQLTPQAAIAAQVSSLKGELLGLTVDHRVQDQVLGTNVGTVAGPGVVYRGTVDSPQAPETPVSVVLVAATADNITIVVTVATPGNDTQDQAAVFQRADDVLNSILFARS